MNENIIFLLLLLIITKDKNKSNKKSIKKPFANTSDVGLPLFTDKKRNMQNEY